MPSSEYPDAVLEYVVAQGWTTNLTELREGAYIIAGERKGDSGSEKMLLMIVCEPEQEVTSEHIEYLIKAGREKNVDSVLLTYTVQITENAREMTSEYGIDEIKPEKIRSHNETGEFAVGTDEISMPGSDSDSRSDSVDETATKGKEPTDERIHSIRANYTQSEGRSVGGNLILSETLLFFEPHKIAELSGEKEIKVSYDNIKELNREKRFNRGIKDAIFGGGLRDRLRIRTHSGRELLFAVSNIEDVMNKINRLKQSEQAQTRSLGEYLSETDERSGEPTTLTLGLTASWIIGLFTLIVGSNLFWNQGRLSGLLYMIAGAIVAPYTRRYVESFVGVKFGRWFLVATWIVVCFIAALMYAATPV